MAWCWLGALTGTRAMLHGSPRPRCGCCSLGLAERSSDPARLCCCLGQGCREAEPSAQMGLSWRSPRWHLSLPLAGQWSEPLPGSGHQLIMKMNLHWAWLSTLLQQQWAWLKGVYPHSNGKDKNSALEQMNRHSILSLLDQILPHLSGFLLWKEGWVFKLNLKRKQRVLSA